MAAPREMRSALVCVLDCRPCMHLAGTQFRAWSLMHLLQKRNQQPKPEEVHALVTAHERKEGYLVAMERCLLFLGDKSGTPFSKE